MSANICTCRGCWTVLSDLTSVSIAAVCSLKVWRVLRRRWYISCVTAVNLVGVPQCVDIVLMSGNLANLRCRRPGSLLCGATVPLRLRSSVV